jgi:hypothetical protein
VLVLMVVGTLVVLILVWFLGPCLKGLQKQELPAAAAAVVLSVLSCLMSCCSK